MTFTLLDFVRESNRIEGIKREPTADEVKAHEILLELERVEVSDLSYFVASIQPGAKIRQYPGMDVRVGSHRPIKGGETVPYELHRLLNTIANQKIIYGVASMCKKAYEWHHMYETLHPFMDGNGRSGRALWLWTMGGIEKAPLGFLHHWYYQSLSAGR